MDEFYAVAACLPSWLAEPLSRMSAEKAAQIHELRLKTGASPIATSAGKQTLLCDLLGENGISLRGNSVSLRGTACNHLSEKITQEQLENVFFHLCGGSVHSYENELGHGFFTLQGGHRVGVGGKYLLRTDVLSENGQPRWQLQQATSLNLRIARRKILAIPPALLTLLGTRFTGIVILGEPDSGKTTVLRSIITQLTAQKRTVVVIDEREELAVTGVDMLSGMEKSCAVQLALRTLSPEIIVLDEVGTLAELTALEQGFFGGVDFIASLHAGSFAEAERKPQFQYLQSHGMLRAAALLEGRHAPGVLKELREY